LRFKIGIIRFIPPGPYRKDHEAKQDVPDIIMRGIEQIRIIPSDITHGKKTENIGKKYHPDKNQQVDQLMYDGPISKYCQCKCKQVKVICRTFDYNFHIEPIEGNSGKTDFIDWDEQHFSYQHRRTGGKSHKKVPELVSYAWNMNDKHQQEP
jgi:hypothetical protein